MASMKKLSVLPVDVRTWREPVVQLATLDDARAFILPGRDQDTDLDAELASSLAEASAWVQGPRSATGVCFTAHGLEADYASGEFDLYLPGGRVQANTTPSVTDETGAALSVDRTLAVDGAYYLRLAAPVDRALTVVWTSNWGRVPPVVKAVTLRVANWLWTSRSGTKEDDGGAQFDAWREMLAPWTLTGAKRMGAEAGP